MMTKKKNRKPCKIFSADIKVSDYEQKTGCLYC